MEMCSGMRVEKFKPHLLLTLASLALAVFLVFLQSVISGGVSGPVLVVYQHLVATFVLSALALFLERGTRPPIKFQIFCWAFLLGFLQVTLFQLLLTSSLRYITVTSQTIAMNTLTSVIFVLAVVLRRESFRFCSINGQAKLWGIVISALGASVTVVWSQSELQSSTFPFSGFPSISNRVIGYIMIAGSILAGASASLIVESVVTKFPAHISLSAMVSFFGTLTTAMLAAFTERSALAWRIRFDGTHELLTILYGGILMSGIFFCVQTWCIHKKGPVFASAFSPLLIVFSFLLDTLILGKDAYVGSIVGAVFVVLGLYLLLWAKADDGEKQKIWEESTPLKGPYKPLDKSLA